MYNLILKAVCNSSTITKKKVYLQNIIIFTMCILQNFMYKLLKSKVYL